MPLAIQELTLLGTTYPPKCQYLSSLQTLALAHHMTVVSKGDFFSNEVTCAHFLHFAGLSADRSTFALFQPNLLF